MGRRLESGRGAGETARRRLRRTPLLSTDVFRSEQPGHWGRRVQVQVPPPHHPVGDQSVDDSGDSEGAARLSRPSRRGVGMVAAAHAQESETMRVTEPKTVTLPQIEMARVKPVDRLLETVNKAKRAVN